MKLPNRRRKLLAGVLGLVFVASAVLVGRALVSEVLAFHRGFETVTTGMSETQVVSRLGAAHERSPQFKLGQRGGFEKEYERAANSGSEYYLIWHRYIDRTYTVGFNKGSNVTMKASGGT